MLPQNWGRGGAVPSPFMPSAFMAKHFQVLGQHGFHRAVAPDLAVFEPKNAVWQDALYDPSHASPSKLSCLPCFELLHLAETLSPESPHPPPPVPRPPAKSRHPNARQSQSPIEAAFPTNTSARADPWPADPARRSPKWRRSGTATCVFGQAENHAVEEDVLRCPSAPPSNPAPSSSRLIIRPRRRASPAVGR